MIPSGLVHKQSTDLAESISECVFEILGEDIEIPLNECHVTPTSDSTN
jgi:hypothetical protein